MSVAVAFGLALMNTSPLSTLPLMSVTRAVEPAPVPVTVYPLAVWKAGPTCFVIRLTSEPAYSTFTAPDPVAADEAEAEAAGEDAAAEARGEMAGDVGGGEEPDEPLQPAAASPMKARPTTATRARVDRYVNMIPTLAIGTCGTQQDM